MTHPLVNKLPEHFRARAHAASLPIKPYIQRKTQRSGHYILDSINCKCGVPLRGWVETDNDESKRLGNGTTLIIRRMGFVALNSYREVELEMNDGSRHVTLTCAECARKSDMDFWLDVYLCDLVQWLDDDDRGESAHARGLFCHKYPVAVIRSGRSAE